MNLVFLIIGAVALLILVALVLFPEVRKKATVLFRGAANLFVEDQAKTPEGAKAIFTQAITEAEEKYQTAKDT